MTLLPLAVSKLVGVVRELGPLEAAATVGLSLRSSVPVTDRQEVARFMRAAADELEGNAYHRTPAELG